jgi:glyoxylase-like metal-dependent hydrolase (beta-lactamase superfamily II)/rhodanese-related sulfurtransferase
MLFERFYLGCLAHASYVIGDEAAGVAAVVDPRRDVEPYLTFADAHDVRIAHVILTHLHADFIAGHLELRQRTGAAIYIGEAASTEYASTPLRDGTEIQMGGVRLRALSTPGHTPESTSVVVFDLAHGDAPYAVLTGDTLFIGDVGRPDSLHSKLLTLPDETLVYPAHGAGSLCGKALSQAAVSTIGEQRRENYALQPMSQSAFIDMVTADQPDAPPYFAYDAMMNAREHATLDQVLERELVPLSLDEVILAAREGAQVLDTRDAGEFAASHMAGSINVGLSGPFATWAGTVLDRSRLIVIVAEPGGEVEAALRLGRIGFDHVAGFLKDGLVRAALRPGLLVSTERISPEVAQARLRADTAPALIDVRAPGERQARLIAGSVALPLTRLIEGAKSLDRTKPVIVHCAGGYRSSIAASVLQRMGFVAVSEMAGGISAWAAVGLPTTTPESPTTAS